MLELLLKSISIALSIVTFSELIFSIKLFIFKPVGIIYENENIIVDYERCTVRYYNIPQFVIDRIKHIIGGLMSFIIAVIAFVIDLNNEKTLLIDMKYVVVCCLIAICVVFIVLLLRDIILKIIMYFLNKYTKKHGLEFKIQGGERVF